MARLQMPQQNPRLNFVINDFSGGLVNNVNDVKMKDNQSPDMLNMQFRIDGLIQKRPGTQHIKDTTLGSTLKEVIVYEYKPNEFTYVYNTTNGVYCEHGQYKSLHKLSDVPMIQGSHDCFMGNFYFVDGLYLYCFDYINAELGRIIPPPDGFTPNPKPAINGVDKQTKTGECELVQANEPNGTMTLMIDKCDYWYEPCQYEMEDGYKGANAVPPTPTLIRVKEDRIYLSGNSSDPNMVYISEILTPRYFPASLPIQTPPTDDKVTALELFDNALIIGRRDNIYSLTGNTNRGDSIQQYVLAQVNSHTGITNGNCSDMVFGKLFFVGSDGNFYRLNTPNTNSTTMNTSQLNTTLDLTMKPFNLTASDSRYACTHFDSVNGLWYVQIGDITLVYSYQLRAWTRYDKIDALNFFSYNNVLQFCRRTGSIYRFASKEGNQQYWDEYYDPDARTVIQMPVVAYWTSRNMDMGIPARVKQFRDTYVTSECFDNYKTTVNIKYEIDYVDIHSTFKIENEVSKWNSAKYDVDKFISRNIDRSLPMMLNRRGRTIKVFYGCGYEYWGARQTLPVPGIVPEFQTVYIIPENKLYVRVPRREGFDNKNEKYFMPLPDDELNQALLVHNIMGIYELKGYR